MRRRVVRDALAPARPGAADRAHGSTSSSAGIARDARDGPPIVAVEGGPGLPVDRQQGRVPRDLRAAGARRAGCCWSTTAAPAASALIDCKSVQSFAGRTSGRAFARRAGRCAKEIDARFGRGARDLFATAYAVDDLAAVIRALRLGKVDLYGDSYGSYFVQDFIARHPRLLHSVVLDSAYPRRDTRPLVRVLGRGRAGARWRSSRRARWRGWASCWRACARRRSTGATQDADGSALERARRPARARRHRPGLGLGPGDPARARRLGARRARRRRRAAAAARRRRPNAWNHTPDDASYFSRGAYLARRPALRLPAVRRPARGRPTRSRRSRPPSG